MRFSIIFLCAFSLLFTSCLRVSNKEQKAHMLQNQNLSPSIDTALESAFFTSGQWPQENWWNVFENEELNKIIKQALTSNPTIEATRQRVDIAKEAVIDKRSSLFPMIFFDATQDWEKLSKNGLYHTLNPSYGLINNLLDLTLSFDYELDIWGKNTNTLRASIGELKAQEALEKQTELLISTSLAQAYFAYKTNLIRLNLYQQVICIKQKINQLEIALNNSALASQIPITYSNATVFESQKMLSQVKEDVLNAKHLVNILRGVGPDCDLNFTNYLSQVPQELNIPQDLSSDLLIRRPDLMASLWTVEAKMHLVNAKAANFYPSFNLKGFAGYESLGFRDLFNWVSSTIGLLPKINLPIFKAGQIKSEFRAQKAQFEEAVYNYNQLLLKSFQQVADVIAETNRVYKQKESQEQILQSSSKRYFLTKNLFETGIGTIINQHVTKLELVEKQIENIELIYLQYLSVIKLNQALGGGYTSPSLPQKKITQEEE